MTLIIGYCTIKGVPHVNMKPARRDDEMDEAMLLDGAFSRWVCPECNAHLSLPDDSDTHICLNLCGLSAASAARFTRMLGEISARQDYRRKLIEEGRAIDALGSLARDLE